MNKQEIISIIETSRETNETTLNLSGKPIYELPPEIGSLSNLRALHLYSSQIKTLPPEIGNLKNLTDLNLTGNNLEFIPREIEKLTKLKFLYLGANKLASIPSSMLKLENLIELDLRGNPLPVPFEILSLYKEPKKILKYYFDYVVGDKKPLNEAKILVVGQGSVGKTSLVNRLVCKNFSEDESKTDGIIISKWTPEKEGRKISFNVWDFGGQEIMHATHQFFLTRRSLYLLVLDSRLTQEENRVEYWLKIIQSFGGDSPIIIIGNKTDQHPLDLDKHGLLKKYESIKGFVSVSCKLNKGIDDVQESIMEEIKHLSHIYDKVPANWFTLKQRLENIGKNFITYDEYQDFCVQEMVDDEISQETLLGFLHDLGVVINFKGDPRLEDTNILNPQWVTNGVYKIINSHDLFRKKGTLSVALLDEILNLPEYPRGKRLFIVDMMKKFELCYDIEPDKTFLVPDLLPKDQPDLKFNGVPAFEYAYPVLPSSVITRFIVRMNQKIDDGFVWRTGVVLKIGDNKALVKADIEDRKITIAIDGLEYTRRDALSAIRYQLDEIHNSIKGLDAQKRVPIPEAPEAEPLDYDYLLQLERDGFEEHPVKNGNRLVKVDVRKLLSGVVSEAERKQSAGNTTNIYIGGNVDGNIITGDENEVNR